MWSACAGESVFSRLRARRCLIRENGRRRGEIVWRDREDSPACNAPSRHGRVEPSVAGCHGTAVTSFERQTPLQACFTPRKLCRRTSVPFKPRSSCFSLTIQRLVPQSYLNFLRARLRGRWKFPGLPIVLSQRGRENEGERLALLWGCCSVAVPRLIAMFMPTLSKTATIAIQTARG